MKKNYKAQIKILEEDLEDQKRFVKHRNDMLERLNTVAESQANEVKKLQVRLDACLYAMVLLQHQIKQINQNCNKLHMEKPTLAT